MASTDKLVRIDHDLQRKLRTMSFHSERTIKDIVEQAVREYLARVEASPTAKRTA